MGIVAALAVFLGAFKYDGLLTDAGYRYRDIVDQVASEPEACDSPGRKVDD
jgi:hypothetical protein